MLPISQVGQRAAPVGCFFQPRPREWARRVPVLLRQASHRLRHAPVLARLVARAAARRASVWRRSWRATSARTGFCWQWKWWQKREKRKRVEQTPRQRPVPQEKYALPRCSYWHWPRLWGRRVSFICATYNFESRNSHIRLYLFESGMAFLSIFSFPVFFLTTTFLSCCALFYL